MVNTVGGENLSGSYVPAESLAELEKELEDRLKNDVKESFRDGKYDNCDKWPFQLNIPRFNSLFNPSSYSSNLDSSTVLHNEFASIIKQLKALDMINRISFRIYPLLRKILIVTEGFVCFSLKQIRFGEVKLVSEILENDSLSSTLDSFYSDNDLILRKSEILTKLSFDQFSVESVVEAFEVISSLLCQSINLNSSQDSELLMNFILFNNLQRVFSTFLLYTTFIFCNGVEDSINFDLERIIKLSSLILGNGELLSKNNVENWLNVFFLPIYDILSISFSLFTFDEEASLFYSLMDSINTLEVFISLDLGRLLDNLSNYLRLYTLNLKKFSEIANEQFQSRYNQLGNSVNTPVNSQNPLISSSQTPLIVSTQTPLIVSSQNSFIVSKTPVICNTQSVLSSQTLLVPSSQNGVKLSSQSSSPRESNHSQKSDLKNCITQYSKLYNIISSLTGKLSKLPKITHGTGELYRFMDNVTEIIMYNVKLIVVSDALEYITRKKPNIELTGFLKETLVKSWELSVSIFNSLPFSIINALFYYIGSSFNNKNLLAQVYLYNTIEFKRLNLQEFNKYIKMLHHILKNSEDLFMSPVTFDKNLRGFKTKYLTVKFSTVCQLLLHELNKHSTNTEGILYMFVSWCYSTNPFHQVLSIKICSFISKILEINAKYMDMCRYIMDIILGLCFFTHFDSLPQNTHSTRHSHTSDHSSSDDNAEDCGELEHAFTNLGQVNFYQMCSFSKLRILSNSPLMPWLIEHVALPYTCAFVNSLKSLIKGLHKPNCNCIICHYNCFFTKTHKSTLKHNHSLENNLVTVNPEETQVLDEMEGEESDPVCPCVNSVIINKIPSINHYLELVISISSNWPLKHQKLDQLQSITNTLNKVLTQLVNLLVNLKGKGDVDLKISLFTISIKLTKAISNTKDFKLNNTNLPSLIKLSSILGYQEICKGNTACYMKLLMEIFGILHNILCKDRNEQLFELHKGLYNSLVGKIEKFPLTLTKLEFYKSTNVDLLRTYETNIKSIIEATKGINSQTLRVIYNYRTWKFIIQNNLKTELLSNLSSQTHYNSVNNSVNNLVNGVNVTEKSLEKVLDEMIENGPVRRDGMEYTMLINLLYIKSIQIKELPNEEKSQELTIL